MQKTFECPNLDLINLDFIPRNTFKDSLKNITIE